MSLLNYAVLLAAAASTAYGHGLVKSVQTGSGPITQSFTLDWTYNQAAHTAARAAAPGWFTLNQDNGFVQPNGVASGGPNAGKADPQNIICGVDAQPGGADFPVAAGADLKFIWDTWPESHKGPVITYLAKCPGTTCAGVDKASLKFFKIEEDGLDVATQKFGSDAVNAANAFTWSTPIPRELPDGVYVARHEIIALHSAGGLNEAQLYPNCVNIKVSGGTGTMSTEGVDASTMYSPTDPGLLVNIYGQLSGYTVPGPALRTASGGSAPAPSSSSAAPSSSSAAPSSSVAASSSAAAPTTTVRPSTTLSAVTTVRPVTSAPAGATTVVEVVTTVVDFTTVLETATATAPTAPAPTGSSGSTAKPIPEGVTLEDLLAWLKIILNRTSPTKRSEFFSQMLM